MKTELSTQNAWLVRGIARFPWFAGLVLAVIRELVIEDRFPAIRFHKQREHAGLMADRIADLA